ncbi:MAG: dihydroorotase [Candidatus Thermoplasmatota archaeon]|nr:dihydroorotase [Candidatus Thermoplasmatota archaeon]
MDFTVEGKIYHKGSFEEAYLSIRQGKIAAIKKTMTSGSHLTVGSQVILPAGIDCHVHFRDPGFPKKEDFSTGSAAAAFGGISCVFDMPNTQPQTTSVRALLEKTQRVTQKSYVDFGLLAGVNDENISMLPELSAYCSGFKIFLGSSTNTLHLNLQNLHRALVEAEQAKKITFVHAEDELCLKKHQATEQSLVDHLRCRPARCEEEAIRTVLKNIPSPSSLVHICHLSSRDGLEALRTRPNNISVGVTPHHLFFDAPMLQKNQTFYKVNPPIRSSFDKEALWNGMNTHLIDILESDHAPHTLEEKNVDFDSAPSGVPGVETLYPLMLAAVIKGQLTLDTLLWMLCERPAQLLHLPKGKLEVGRDADFIVVDMKKTQMISGENLHSKCGWTPFEGYPAIFPSLLFIRGEQVIDDHQLLVKQGFGASVGV